MTQDHKPMDADEYARIMKVGGRPAPAPARRGWRSRALRPPGAARAPAARPACPPSPRPPRPTPSAYPPAPLQAGGFVADGRVNGSLNLSRALGDLEYKQAKELGPEEQVGGRAACAAAPRTGPRAYGRGGCPAGRLTPPTSCSSRHHRQMVTALPDVRREALQPGDEFLVLACDGIWDVLTNQEVGARASSLFRCL